MQVDTKCTCLSWIQLSTTHSGSKILQKSVKKKHNLGKYLQALIQKAARVSNERHRDGNCDRETDRAVAQVVRRWLLTSETQVQSRMIRGRRNNTLVGFLPSSSVFPLLIIIPPLLHTHLSPPHEVCDSPDQEAHYHTLGTKLGASSLTRHLTGFVVKSFLVYAEDSYCR
jgi:hypothetical protein